MNVDVIEPAQFVKHPWRNGGGTALEILRVPPGDASFDVRISVADIALSGPFSIYQGYDRWLLMIEGHVALSLGSSKQSIDLAAPDAAPLRFAGETHMECTLKSPSARALNVFARKGKLDLALVVAEERTLEGPGEWAVVGIQGAVEVKSEEPKTLSGLSTARVELSAGEKVTVSATVACALVVRLSPKK
ncbi:MAG: HutD family protein [Polyangiaceae bacterium]